MRGGNYLNSGWGQAGLLRMGRRLKVKEKGKDMKPHKSEEMKKHNETSYKKIWSKEP